MTDSHMTWLWSLVVLTAGTVIAAALLLVNKAARTAGYADGREEGLKQGYIQAVRDSKNNVPFLWQLQEQPDGTTKWVQVKLYPNGDKNTEEQKK